MCFSTVCIDLIVYPDINDELESHRRGARSACSSGRSTESHTGAGSFGSRARAIRRSAAHRHAALDRSMTIVEAGAALRAGKISCRELTEEALRSAARENPRLNAF